MLLSSLRPSAVAANQLRADLLALCEAAVQSVRSRPFMTTDDIERTITSIVDDCFEMRGRIMDADEKPDERDAPASVTRSVAVEDAQPADAADPILGQVTAALSSGEGQGVLVSVFNELRRTIDPSGADVDPHTLGSVAKTATSFSEFIGMLQTSDISSSKDSKDVTRFLATNGLEIASTVVNVAKAAADFVPIPGLSAAVGMIDRIVKNVQDTRGSPRIVEDFCADLIDVKNIIAPMASQWFSADVRRKCNDLLALLKDAQRVTDQARAGSNSWAALLGNTTAKVEAQVESLRRQLARIKELLCLAIQVDSAMMLMRMAKQLNIIDIKADKMLS
nr:hypothetical protein HK105_006998 [Polyrhizophydium stewartii]